MSCFRVSLFLSLVALTGGLSGQNQAPRLKMSINDGWRFTSGVITGAEAPDHNDSTWQKISLPHTWNRQDAFEKERDYYRGIGWYRKTLRLDKKLQEKRLFLLFEAANQVAEVWLNGKKAGRHIGGYSAFSFDITEFARFDSTNVLAVQVDNRHDEDIPPLNADFTFYGGIYRDVWLIASSPVHIDILDHGSPGVFISTPGLAEQDARVRVRGTLVNDDLRPHSVTLLQRIMDYAGDELLVMEQRMELAAKSSADFDQISSRISTPHLWSPDSPRLYRVITEVYAGDVILDALENPLGFRWFSVDAQNGFYLNGKPLKLYGTNRHQDLQGFGNALPDWAHRRDVQIIKSNGFNLLRLAHYPQDNAVLQEADRLGMLIWEEIPVVNLIGMSETFANNCRQMLREMIRQHYNHPSVVMWGYMNEVMLRKPEPVPQGYNEALLTLARQLETVTRDEDDSRLTVTAQSNGEVFNGKGVSEIPHILGLNLYFGWYYDQFATLGTFLDGLNRDYADRPLLVSEYGAGSDERVHAKQSRSFDFSNEYQQHFHEANFRIIRERGYLTGSAVWNQFDFGSTHRQDTKNAVNQKGLYYFDRTPKDIAFFYRAHLLQTAVLHIAARDYPHRAGSLAEDARFKLTVYSNLARVELLLNGISQGVKGVKNCLTNWDIILQDGENHLTARGETDGRTITDEFVVHYSDRRGFFKGEDATAREVAVNAGGHYSFVDEGEVVWEADRAFSPGSWGFTGGEAQRTHHRIYDTTDDPLFQAARVGVETWRIDAPDGWYQIELGFAEIQPKQVGERVFSVTVNGLPVFSELDLVSEYGLFRAACRKVAVQVQHGMGISVRFEPVAGEALVNAIRISRY